MSEFFETDDRRTVLKNKLRQYFDGKIVRKDLTKKIKEGANVPVYVLGVPSRSVLQFRRSRDH